LAAARRHLLDVARQVVGMVATAATGVLLDAVPLAVIQKPRLTRGARLGVLPGGKPSFGVGSADVVKLGCLVPAL
jgi:hypothetical protein